MTTKPAEPLTVTITEKAADKAKHFAQKEGKAEAFVLRVAVKGGGCSGLQYVLEVVDGPGPNDKVIEQHGVKLCVDKRSFVFLAGTVLDFSDGLNGKGFVFQNPNAKSVCGCGNSFSV